ncbi:hypothetical protein FB45DRAFT_1151654 [Roridomyces roridus]|uniref:Uncharacterized protein n=1 Tax=Roridomyces roridus TaxID=1738132 RepID=A0AAD7FPI0_9AGAR|nr:hypothetical protein FB45DRAFT_1151654 [Roridomyces roridus]
MSDTESESEVLEIDPFLDHFHALNLETSKTIATAIHDIQHIEVTDPQAVEQDTELHAVISEASTAIICFLDSVHTPNDDSSKRLNDFAQLVDVAFLTALFEHRKIFNQIAAQSLAPGPSSAVVCWVDVILFKLGDAVVPIASGVSVDFASPLFPVAAEDGLRAASQLPSEWSSVIELVASDKASSAAKRLALRLSYAAFVLGPCLRPEISPIQTPHSMEEVLNRCVAQTRTATGFSASRAGDELAIQERLNCAMIIALFAATNYRRGSHLRPHTLGSLLSILQNVLHPEDTVASLQLVAPPDALDPAQTMLLRWGDTVSWCWETWDDHRVADAESIVFLTSTWLLHVSAPSFLEESSCMSVSTSSCIAILRVLHHIVLSFSTAYPALPSSVPMAVISQACYHSIESLNTLLLAKKEDERWIISGICKYLLSLFVMVGDTNEEHCVDEYILEALSLVDADTLRVCLTQIQGDSLLRFPARLDERILRVKKCVTIDMAPDARTLNFIRSALHFAIIIWFSQTPGCLLRQSISPVLSKILDLVSQESASQLQSRILADAVLTAFSAARRDPSCSDDSREVVSQFVVRAALPDLAVASSFAHYITTSQALCSPLSCAQAWRHLGDCLALILRNHYAGEQEPLALLVCPTICSALIRLLRADPTSTRFMISTPFTLNLCADLKAVCGGARSGQYFDVMKERLATLGPRLLDQILRKSRNEDLPDSVESTPMRLLFYRMHGLSHLSDSMDVDAGPSSYSSPIQVSPPTPAFAASSAEFHIFPRTNPAVDRNTTRRATNHSVDDALNLDSETSARLARQRSEAFFQLQQTVADNGDSFVKSMRVYESRRLRSTVHMKVKEAQRRGRRSSLAHPSRSDAQHDSDESDDDVQIFAGENIFIGRGKQRSSSVGLVQTKPHHSPSERSSSPGGTTTCDSSPSLYLSDDDSMAPTLSHSANSSIVSLALPPASAAQIPSSRSEKALAALTLAMANGAGGLDDYEALRSLHTFSPLDSCQVGDMWH